MQEGAHGAGDLMLHLQPSCLIPKRTIALHLVFRHQIEGADKTYMLRELDNAAWQQVLFLGLGLQINGIPHLLEDF